MSIEEILSNLTILETERLILRQITLDDIEDMNAYCSNDEVSKYGSWNAHKSLSDTKECVELILSNYENKKVVLWGIQYKENGKLIGTIEYVLWDPKHKVAELGYVISQNYWGIGIATEAVNEVIKFGFNNMDLVRIQARCFVENTRSARVMEKAGMSFEGIIRKAMFAKSRHHDLKMYSILRDTGL
ncbi:GNAT family protein [Paenibacillus sp. LjRoot153]|uniref:GNAT family N-acetyltransferase n=1 Tax=Paenibacillus sp. LjRoot153 TaxID=3342270 RepID=UPI003ECEBC57